MRPLVRAAVGAAAVIVIARGAEELRSRRSAPERAGGSASAPHAASAATAPCPAGSLPDHHVCIPVPTGSTRGQAPESVVRERRAPSGQLASHEFLPRRPDRPAEYARYRLPIRSADGRYTVRQGRALEPAHDRDPAAFGAGGIELSTTPGASVQAVRLEHQEGETRLVFAGELAGPTVLTAHTVREASGARDYVLIHARLERIAPELRAGRTLAAGAALGSAGGSVYLEVRRLRDGAAIGELEPRALIEDDASVACDARNVLELVAPASP